jgi:methionyl-tRNA formyltransferase
MIEKIDDGKNILFKEYDIPLENVDIDSWFDNVVRADSFVSAIDKITSNNMEFENTSGDSDEYYVIHPVLKHCAILSLKEK